MRTSGETFVLGCSIDAGFALDLARWNFVFRPVGSSRLHQTVEATDSLCGLLRTAVENGQIGQMSVAVDLLLDTQRADLILEGLRRGWEGHASLSAKVRIVGFDVDDRALVPVVLVAAFARRDRSEVRVADGRRERNVVCDHLAEDDEEVVEVAIEDGLRAQGQAQPTARG